MNKTFLSLLRSINVWLNESFHSNTAQSNSCLWEGNKKSNVSSAGRTKDREELLHHLWGFLKEHIHTPEANFSYVVLGVIYPKPRTTRGCHWSTLKSVMDSIRKTSQRALTVYALFLSLCSTGKCFQVFMQHIFWEVVFAFSCSCWKLSERFFSSRKFDSEKLPRKL